MQGCMQGYVILIHYHHLWQRKMQRMLSAHVRMLHIMLAQFAEQVLLLHVRPASEQEKEPGLIQNLRWMQMPEKLQHIKHI